MAFLRPLILMKPYTFFFLLKKQGTCDGFRVRKIYKLRGLDLTNRELTLPWPRDVNRMALATRRDREKVDATCKRPDAPSGALEEREPLVPISIPLLSGSPADFHRSASSSREGVWTVHHLRDRWRRRREEGGGRRDAPELLPRRRYPSRGSPDPFRFFRGNP